MPYIYYRFEERFRRNPIKLGKYLASLFLKDRINVIKIFLAYENIYFQVLSETLNYENEIFSHNLTNDYSKVPIKLLWHHKKSTKPIWKKLIFLM